MSRNHTWRIDDVTLVNRTHRGHLAEGAIVCYIGIWLNLDDGKPVCLSASELVTDSGYGSEVFPVESLFGMCTTVLGSFQRHFPVVAVSRGVLDM